MSADFLASDFIVNQELSPLLKIAEQEDVIILPIIVRQCAAFEHSELAQFKTIHPRTQPLNRMKPAKRDSIWSSLAERICEILKSIAPQQSNLDTVLEEMGKTIVAHTRLEQLRLILSANNWPVQFLRRAYRVSNPMGRSSLLNIGKHSDPLLLMLEDLATLPTQSDGTIPLLVFSCCLQAYIQPQEQKELQTTLSKWIHESIEECQLDTYQVASLKRRASELQLRTSYHLLIMLDPESKNLFWIRTWLLDSNNTVLPNVRVDCEDEPMSLEQIPAILNELLEQCADYVEEDEKLLIEFVLPNELLRHPVDHFLVNDDMTDIKLGIRYQVVVRSLQPLMPLQVSTQQRINLILKAISRDFFFAVQPLQHCPIPCYSHEHCAL